MIQTANVKMTAGTETPYLYSVGPLLCLDSFEGISSVLKANTDNDVDIQTKIMLYMYSYWTIYAFFDNRLSA